MTNVEQFNKLVEDGELKKAAIHAAYCAKGKASRSGRSNWLAEVTTLRPDLGKEIRRADNYCEFEPLMAALEKDAPK